MAAAPGAEQKGGSRSSDAVKGYLVLGIEDVSGKNSNDALCWDTSPSMGLPFEAFVRAELRGGSKTVKANTRKVPIINEDILLYEQDLSLEVLEGASELRLMLCREKYVNGKKGTAVIAACGLFMEDIQEADLPLDKYFELFKPHGGEGGYIHLSLNLLPTQARLEEQEEAQDNAAAQVAESKPAQPPAAAGAVEPDGTRHPRSNGMRGLRTALIVLAWAGVVVAAVGAAATNNRRKPKKKPAPGRGAASPPAQAACAATPSSSTKPLASTPPRSSWWGS